MASTRNESQTGGVHSWEQYLQLRGESDTGFPDEALPPTLRSILFNPVEEQEDDTQPGAIDRLNVTLPNGSVAKLRWERLVLEQPASELLEGGLTIPDWEFDVDDLAPMLYIPKEELPEEVVSEAKPVAFESFVRDFVGSSERGASTQFQSHCYSISQWLEWMNVDISRVQLLMKDRKYERALLADRGSGFADFLLLHVFPRSLELDERLTLSSLSSSIDLAMEKSSFIGLSQKDFTRKLKALDASSKHSRVTEFYEVDLARAYRSLRNRC